MKLVKEHTGKWYDVLYERALLKVHIRKFAEVLHDYMLIHNDYTKYYSHDIEFYCQKLDPAGASRIDMFCAVELELCKMKPQSAQEAAEMLALSNRLARSMLESRIKITKDAYKAVLFSQSLLSNVQDHDDLKADTKLLWKEVNERILRDRIKL
jgi:hypothetical protein